MSVPQPPAVPSAQQLPPPYPPADAPTPAPAKKNTLALIAMIVAIVGFIFACVPGALVVGWILLPIAFVISIVSLFLKGDRKWMGVVGLIVSVVGTIVGFIVFFALLAGAASDALSGGETTVTQPVEEADAEASVVEEDVVEEEAPAAVEGTADGTRENPYPLGSQISTDDWTVVVNSHTADGSAAVAETGFNDPAPAGSHYEIVNYTVTYTGEESSYAAMVTVALVTSTGNVVNSYDSIAILSDGFGLDELYNGASATGSQAFLVPDGETALIRVSPGILADEVFVQP